MVEKSPSIDRFLMRLKDFIIIGAAVGSMINWIYNQSLRLKEMEDRIVNLERAVYRTRK